jgi:O-acetyl-ADP-ribose deacetylase (regulator of RNase III)
MLTKAVEIVLVDINPRMVRAWQHAFERNAEVRIVQGSMLNQGVDAWVSPTNSRGTMDGGLDWVIKNHLGARIEKQVKREISILYGGFLPVGHATSVETGWVVPKYVISTPTMFNSSESISGTVNVALACAAALQAVEMVNARTPSAIGSVALPGLGASTGQVPPETCAYLMWIAYELFRFREFADFAEVRRALESEIWRLERSGAA